MCHWVYVYLYGKEEVSIFMYSRVMFLCGGIVTVPHICMRFKSFTILNCFSKKIKDNR